MVWGVGFVVGWTVCVDLGVHFCTVKFTMARGAPRGLYQRADISGGAIVSTLMCQYLAVVIRSSKESDGMVGSFDDVISPVIKDGNESEEFPDCVRSLISGSG